MRAEEGRAGGGHSKDTQSTGQRQGRNPAEPRRAVLRTLSYLLVGVRPIEAQEEVGGCAVQEQIGCPEWDGKASDGATEVERDPEVLRVGVCEDVLQRKEAAGAGLAELPIPSCSERLAQGPAGLTPPALSPSPAEGGRSTPSVTQQRHGCRMGSRLTR